MKYPKGVNTENGNEHEGAGEIPAYDEPSPHFRAQSREHEEKEGKQEARGQDHDGKLPGRGQKCEFFCFIQIFTARI
jgi:hypothetical protein